MELTQENFKLVAQFSLNYNNAGRNERPLVLNVGKVEYIIFIAFIRDFSCVNISVYECEECRS